MPELVTITRQRSRPPSWPARVWQSVRATWTGPWSAKDPALANLFSDGARSSAGIAVTPEVAFTYSAVYDAVNQIASDVAKMPLNLMKRLPNGGSMPYSDAKLYRILKHQPNPEMGSMVMRRQMTAWALCSHGGFAEIQRDTLGRPAALWPIEPHRVTVKRGKMRGVDGHVREDDLYYEIDGGASTIPIEDMLHLQGLGYTPHEPYGVINKARQAIGLALAAERFGATFFGNGSTFGGLLTTDSSLGIEEAKALREVIEGIHQGPDRAHKLAVLWGGLKYQKLGVAPNEAQMNELRDKQIEEVARFFRIPPHRLGLNKPGTVSYASVEMANLDYYTGCLLDWITLWEEECNRKLIPAMEYKLQYVKHNANVFLRADFEKRMAGYGMALDKGLYSRNEVRALEDMGPQDGEQGDWYLVQEAQVPLHMLAEVKEAAMAPPAPEPTPPAEPESEPEPEGDDDEVRAEILAAITAMEAKIAEVVTARADAEAREDAAQAAHFAERAEAMAAEAATLRVQLEAATASAAAAESSVESERAARLALEVERDTLRQDVGSARQALSEAEALAAARQADVAAAEAVRDEQVLAADDAVQALAAIQARLDAATGDEARAVIEAERQAAQALVDEAAHAAQAARDEADAARIEAESARASVEAAEAARVAAEDRAVQSETALAAAQAEASAAQEAHESARAQATALQIESARVSDESSVALAAAEARVADAEARAEAARVAAESAETQAQSSAQAREQAIAAAEALQAEAAEQIRSAEAALAEARQAIKSRDASLLAASRALIVEAMGVLVRRETAQARSKQATPQKLQRWLAGMAVLHEPVCVERLVAPVRLHLALTNRAEDAEQVAAQMAAAHLAEFRRQMEAVLAVDVDEFHVALERVLTRWESERPEAVADALLVEGIRHVSLRDGDIVKITLSERWSNVVRSWPESGMGYHRADVTFNDKRELSGVVVVNAEYLQVPSSFAGAAVVDVRPSHADKEGQDVA